jgi:hypothetical protein
LYSRAYDFASKLPDSDLGSRILRLTCLGDAAWQQGRLWLAKRHLRKGLADYQSGTDAQRSLVPQAIFRELQMTFLHWYRDYGKLVGPLLRGELGDLAVATFNDLATAPSPQDLEKLLRLRNEARGLRERGSRLTKVLSATPELEPGAAFQEVDSVLGVINMTRRSILSELSAGKSVSADRINALARWSQLIGDRAGYLKSCLLMRRLKLRTAGPVMPTLLEIEWRPLLKMRWLASWVLGRGEL